MQLKTILVGHWYETKQGTGQCLKVGGTHPPSIRFRIVLPFPRGEIFLTPRDVLKEVPDPSGVTPPGGKEGGAQ